MASADTLPGAGDSQPALGETLVKDGNNLLSVNNSSATLADKGLLITEGCCVVIDFNSDKHAFATVKQHGMLKVGKSQVSMEPLLGAPFGSCFELSADGKSLVRREHINTEDWSSVMGTVRNNANIFDQGAANQQLTAADIDRMRREGMTGEAIIAALAANSATWGEKTEFSQQKYKKKKAKKYIFVVQVFRPTARSVCEAYFGKAPAKISHMRADSLALMLSLANVSAHGRLLVMETCGGMVAAAACERMGGQGNIIVVHEGSKPPSLDIPRQFNFSPAALATISTAPLQELEQLRSAQQADNAVGQTSTSGSDDTMKPPKGLTSAPHELLRSLLSERGGFDGAIMAATGLSPMHYVPRLLSLLQPSSPFAVFGNHLQYLAETMSSLQQSRVAVALQLQECWWREHQVLPGRTHPHMSASGGGGYLLSGIAVTPVNSSSTESKRQRLV